MHIVYILLHDISTRFILAVDLVMSLCDLMYIPCMSMHNTEECVSLYKVLCSVDRLVVARL